MGWNKYRSKNHYGSLSRYSLMIGCLSTHIAVEIVASDASSLIQDRSKWQRIARTRLPQKYEGPSKAMEVDTPLPLCKHLFEGNNNRLLFKSIGANNELSSKALLKHRSRYTKGTLHLDIPEPEWLIDLSHRLKVIAKLVYLLSLLPKNPVSG